MKQISNTLSAGLIIAMMITVIFLNKAALFNLCKEFYVTAVNGSSVTNENMNTFEEDYKNILQRSSYWINGYGISQKLLLKRDLGDVLCDDQGILYLKDNGNPTSEEVIRTAENISKLYECAEELEIPFLFVQCPYKNYSKIEVLQGYGMDTTEEMEDKLVEELMAAKVPVLDLRDYFSGNVHYITDHHWTCETAFKANNVIMQYLYEEFGIPLSRQDLEYYSDERNYETVGYPSCFLGSIGIRAGEGYTKKEDFSVIIPKFSTDFSYSHLIDGETEGVYSGSFELCFLDETLLLDKNYKNKYMAFLRGGYVENIIENQISNNELKTLLVSHSYGRAMVPYMSLFFKETRYLDPQKGRYNKSYLKYIYEYRPNIIIVMYNGEIQL